MKSKKLSVFSVFIGWLTFGQILMLVISSLGGAPLIDVYSAVSKLVPALAHMNSGEYFDPTVARQQAVVAYLAMPILVLLLFRADVSSHCEGVIKKGPRNVMAVMIVFVVVGLLPLFFGLAPKRLGATFRESQIGFAFLSSFVTFACVYLLRLAYYLFSNFSEGNKS